MKFLFLSRHALTPDQIADLTSKGFTEFAQENPPVLSMENCIDVVMDAAERHYADVIGLVAPGRIWVELAHKWEQREGHNKYRPMLCEAESRPAPELRKGDGPIPFAHVAWHPVIQGVRPCQCGSGRHWQDCSADTFECG